jgi:transcriptional regulator with XRE-family HTH domain
VRGGDVIREARLRAGLSQHELAARSGRDRSVIARWEQGTVSPSLDTLLEIVHACGFDLPLELVLRNDAADDRLRRNARLSPERRVQQMLRLGSRVDG